MRSFLSRTATTAPWYAIWYLPGYFLGNVVFACIPTEPLELRRDALRLTVGLAPET